MRIIPASHKWGVVPHDTVDGDFGVPESALDLSNEVLVELKAGSCLFFHSLLMHGSSPNHSNHPRRALIGSYMRGDSRYTGSDEEPTWFVVSSNEQKEV